MKVYDFEKPEDFAELEKQAYCGTIDYSMFPPAAYRYFDKLTKLYAEFKEGGITKELAEQTKRKIYCEYKTAWQDYKNWLSVWKEHQNAIRLAGTGLAAINKSKDVYEIAKNACAVIGLMTGDKSFYKCQLKKIEGNDT